jgi:hypothetical protein
MTYIYIKARCKSGPGPTAMIVESSTDIRYPKGQGYIPRYRLQGYELGICIPSEIQLVVYVFGDQSRKREKRGEKAAKIKEGKKS